MKYLFVLIIIFMILNKKIESFNNFSNNIFIKCCRYFGCSHNICYNYLINSSRSPLNRNIVRDNSLGSYPNKIYDNKYNYISPHILNSPKYLILHKRFSGKNKWSYYANRNNKLVKLKDYDNIKSENIKYVLFNNKKYYFS